MVRHHDPRPSSLKICGRATTKNMTTKIVWRLKERPTPSEIKNLLEAKIIDKDEAREILFSLETEEDRDKKSLETEIIFLRKMVEKLAAGNNQTIISTIHDCHRPHYDHYPWYGRYQVWCSNLQSGGANTVGITAGTGMTTIAHQGLLTGATAGTGDINNNLSDLNGSSNITWSAGSGSNGAMQSASFSDIKTW